jgi:hypothetical protein
MEIADTEMVAAAISLKLNDHSGIILPVSCCERRLKRNHTAPPDPGFAANVPTD